MRILGISAGFHDAAAALVVNGRPVAAMEEERLSRIKHDASFPSRAMDSVLRIAEVEPADIDLVTYHEKPIGVVMRTLYSRLRSGPAGIPTLLTRTPRLVRDHLAVQFQIDHWFRARRTATPAVLYGMHHSSHAAAAFYPSPFQEAAVLTVDGVGEWATTSVGLGVGHRLTLDAELRFPHSIGLVYSAFTAYCGFRVNGGEGELMGLAPFGEPRHLDDILGELMHIGEDGSVEVNQRYFAYVHGRRMTNRRFHRLFGGPPRPLGAPPTRREADLAASMQRALEVVLDHLARAAHRRSGLDQLTLAGGVALNCAAVGRLLADGPFDDVWVQPAAGDAGSALGGALHAWHDHLGNPRRANPLDNMNGALLGAAFSQAEVHQWLKDEQIPHLQLDDDELLTHVARRLADGEIVGWFSGRMEFGPRALGSRSILADPRSSTVQARINSMVKERASFRPFAPAVLRSRVADHFSLDRDAPYMTMTAPVSEDLRCTPDDTVDSDSLDSIVAQVRSTLPAITHVDHSARVQTVGHERHPRFASLIEAFERETGCPVLLNTSFNARDEPIVATPADAYRTFRRTGLDALVIEDCVVTPDGRAHS